MAKKKRSSNKKNPCRVIRVKRKLGRSKKSGSVYARRKFCFNPVDTSRWITYDLHPSGDKFTFVLRDEISGEQLRKIINVSDTVKIRNLLVMLKLKNLDEFLLHQRHLGLDNHFQITAHDWELIKGWI